EGTDLRTRLKDAPLPVAEAVEIAVQVADGLAFAHERGVVHRDIKPQNIFLDRDGKPKIGDLGLARSSDGEDRMTMTGTSYGTPSYMSPEQIRGVADIDIRSDIYALG
ncbi:serine/threonine-protein kinase, partial [Klebsiella pneumoniae]|uniref:serine/threonine-protein kinase n=1 Tax=Klebsiella pneumoniae TaxID=573 RepID=UPI003A849654